ncbi:methylated-DNA--[protein]-cysteine S-methyltransferase [Aurantimonas sp. VKM B-3413]|uniref:methylated-DNA--[protein]-cysteine S-methyltransferase n=1 Tax=Aurantimonas sp. VKM B-3413 TaxID=2779401 RepID=UPI001E4714FE|nr:methylated-DNA--[protein]-cysteine S-methyltransferase [Aurantimonas sp. VKM B-3413]MCB8839211.1 methylated-DNA--[protein]-cysteine S-methyltransferase [Aurantimonas sp. VKM B-3413]
MAPPLSYTYVESPIGLLLVAGDETALQVLKFPGGRGADGPQPGWRRDNGPFAEAARQIEAYFAGELRRFDLPLRFRGSPFQERVWHALADIPYGETRSYGEVAALIGAPEASRAVGLAAGRNPLPIVLPCHRVIGANGQLTGFGGGLPTKTFLLRLEGNRAGAPSAQLSLL